MIEPTILGTNANGELEIRLEQDGQTLRLIPETHTLRETLSPDERARTFRDWVAGMPKRKGPAIPGEALRRENLYD